MADGRWQMADGKWQMANGKWQMANGKWQMADGRWQMANGKWQSHSSADCGIRNAELFSLRLGIDDPVMSHWARFPLILTFSVREKGLLWRGRGRISKR